MRGSVAARGAATPQDAASGAPIEIPAPTSTAAPHDHVEGATHTPERPPITLASGIFITGNVGLVAGSRYTIQVEGEHFQVLGPVDVDPMRIALDRPVSGMDATAFEGRLVISEPGRTSGGVVMAFMSLAGGSPIDVADALVRLADPGIPA